MNASGIDTLELGQRVKEDNVNVWPVETPDGAPFQIEFQNASLKPKDDKLFVQNRPRSRELDKTLIALENKLLALLKPKVKTKDDDALLSMIKMHLVNENANVIYKFHVCNVGDFNIESSVLSKCRIRLESINASKAKIAVVWKIDYLSKLPHFDSEPSDDDDTEDKSTYGDEPDPEPDNEEIEGIRKSIKLAIDAEEQALKDARKRIDELEVIASSIGSFYNDHSSAFTLENLNHIRDCLENFRETRARLLS